MKNRIIRSIITASCITLVGVSAIGCNTIHKAVASKVDRVSQIKDNEHDNWIKNMTLIEKYDITTQESCDRCYKALENRNGKIIVEVVHGMVIDADGNGQTVTGDYIKYDSDYSIGDKVETTLVYNPSTNAVDDVIYRSDVVY